MSVLKKKKQKYTKSKKLPTRWTRKSTFMYLFANNILVKKCDKLTIKSIFIEKNFLIYTEQYYLAVYAVLMFRKITTEFLVWIDTKKKVYVCNVTRCTHLYVKFILLKIIYNKFTDLFYSVFKYVILKSRFF